MLSFSQPISRGNAAVRGLLAAALGVTLVVWPGITIGTVVALFAVSVFADAVVAGARAFGDGRRTEDRGCSACAPSSTSPPASSRSPTRARPRAS